MGKEEQSTSQGRGKLRKEPKVTLQSKESFHPPGKLLYCFCRKEKETSLKSGTKEHVKEGNNFSRPPRNSGRNRLILPEEKKGKRRYSWSGRGERQGGDDFGFIRGEALIEKKRGWGQLVMGRNRGGRSKGPGRLTLGKVQRELYTQTRSLSPVSRGRKKSKDTTKIES